MPCIDANARRRILEGFVLQPLLLQPEAVTHVEQQRFIGGDEVGHGLALEHVAMEPEAAAQGVYHAPTALGELVPSGAYIQAITPSSVEAPTGAAVPLNSAHSTPDDWVCAAMAAQPVAVASAMVSVTPAL